MTLSARQIGDGPSELTRLRRENERLRAAFKDILLLDGKQLTARQKYAHAAILAERALDPHGQSVTAVAGPKLGE